MAGAVVAVVLAVLAPELSRLDAWPPAGVVAAVVGVLVAASLTALSVPDWLSGRSAAIAVADTTVAAAAVLAIAAAVTGPLSIGTAWPAIVVYAAAFAWPITLLLPRGERPHGAPIRAPAETATSPSGGPLRTG